MAVIQYRIGRVSVAHGATEIVGSGGMDWMTVARPLDSIAVAGRWTKIMAIVDANHIAIEPWPYDSVVDADYVVVCDGLNSFAAPQVAQAVVTLAENLAAQGITLPVKPGASSPAEWLGDNGQYAQQYDTGRVWFKDGGVWQFVGVFKALGTPEIYDATKTYQSNQLVVHLGSAYVSRKACRGIAPPDPECWLLFAAKGDTGAKGDKGEKGDKGDKGEDGLGTGDMRKVDNLAGLQDRLAARNNLDFSAIGNALATAQDAIAARNAIGASQIGHVLYTAANGAELIQALQPIFADLPWLSIPIGSYVLLDTRIPGVAAPSKTSALYRYIDCTEGLSGAGGYNEAVLTNEISSGSGPTKSVTAVVNLPGSPYHRLTINLINSEERVIYAAVASGAVWGDQMQRITGSACARVQSSTDFEKSGAFSGSSIDNTQSWLGTTLSLSRQNLVFDSASSPGARTGDRTRAKGITMRAFLRIK